MKQNPVVIFPDPALVAWDHLPRFTVLDTDIRGMNRGNKKLKDGKRIHALEKSRFVGSPVRTQAEGGVLKDGSNPMAKQQQSKGTSGADILGCKDSIGLYWTMNDILIKRLMNDL